MENQDKPVLALRLPQYPSAPVYVIYDELAENGYSDQYFLAWFRDKKVSDLSEEALQDVPVVEAVFTEYWSKEDQSEYGWLADLLGQGASTHFVYITHPEPIATATMDFSKEVEVYPCLHVIVTIVADEPPILSFCNRAGVMLKEPGTENYMYSTYKPARFQNEIWVGGPVPPYSSLVWHKFDQKLLETVWSI